MSFGGVCALKAEIGVRCATKSLIMCATSFSVLYSETLHNLAINHVFDYLHAERFTTFVSPLTCGNKHSNLFARMVVVGTHYLQVGVEVDGESFVAAAAGEHHTLVVTQYGDVLTFGRGKEGQLGHGEASRLDMADSPRKVGHSVVLVVVGGGARGGAFLFFFFMLCRSCSTYCISSPRGFV